MKGKVNDMVTDSNLIISEVEVGNRVECSGYLGTIKYIGPVEGYSGIWLGVDWDDRSRGKHNGTVKNVQYFKTRYESSGSFVRREKVDTGQSITKAIIKKYGCIDSIEMTENERIHFTQSTKAPFLELVGLDKVAKLQSNFETLSIVDLRLCNISSIGSSIDLKTLCPNICDLSLSKNLLTSWKEIFDICQQLDKLSILKVSENILFIPEHLEQYKFPNVRTLVCGKMNLTWTDIEKLSTVFTQLKDLLVPDNEIRTISLQSSNLLQLSLLNLEGNNIENWSNIMEFRGLPQLETLNLIQTGLNSIQFDDSLETDAFPALKKLNISENFIEDWLSIGELNKLNCLEDLRFVSNPILEKEGHLCGRQIAIAMIKTLKSVNGSTISSDERRGAEYDYLKKYGLEWLNIKTEEERQRFLKEHTRYLELIQMYGNLEESELKVQSNILKSALISLNIVSGTKTIKKKFPPTLLVQKLIVLVQKVFKMNERPSLLYKSEQSNVEIVLEDEMKEISLYSMQNGDSIIVLA